MVQHKRRDVGVNYSRALLKAGNGLHMGSTGSVSDNEVVFITVGHPIMESEAVMM